MLSSDRSYTEDTKMMYGIFTTAFKTQKKSHNSARKSPTPAHKTYSLSLDPTDLDDTDRGPWVFTQKFR